jgi:hypothetical protein
MIFKKLFISMLAVFLIVQTLATVKMYMDNSRLSDNFTALAEGTEYYRINDSISAARSERIILDNAEIKTYFPEIKSTIAQMDVKLRQLERYSAVSSTANYNITSRLQDTVKVIQTIIQDRIIRDTVKLQYIMYRDKWIDFQQAIVADSAYTAIQTRDSIAIVQSWTRPHKFLFVQWGRKRHIQTVTNANPNATITYSIFVEKQ